MAIKKGTKETNFIYYIILISLIILSSYFAIINLPAETTSKKINGHDIHKLEIRDYDYTYFEAIKEIRSGVGTKSINEVKNICKSLENRNDNCLLYASKTYEEQKLCKVINRNSTADYCHLFFVVNHQYDECDMIHENSMRNICYILEQLEKGKTFLTTEDEEKIQEIALENITSGIKHNYTYHQTLGMIKREIVTPKEAKELCKNLKKNSENCLLYASRIYQEGEFCHHIEDKALNDLCHFHFIINLDYENCEDINENSLRNICSNINKLREIQVELNA